MIVPLFYCASEHCANVLDVPLQRYCSTCVKVMVDDIREHGADQNVDLYRNRLGMDHETEFLRTSSHVTASNVAMQFGLPDKWHLVKNPTKFLDMCDKHPFFQLMLTLNHTTSSPPNPSGHVVTIVHGKYAIDSHAYCMEPRLLPITDQFMFAVDNLLFARLVPLNLASVYRHIEYWIPK